MLDRNITRHLERFIPGFLGLIFPQPRADWGCTTEDCFDRFFVENLKYVVAEERRVSDVRIHLVQHARVLSMDGMEI